MPERDAVMSASIKYFVYARKSTDDEARQLRSIDDQIAEVMLLAKAAKLVIVDVLTERQSAKYPGRPVFNAMLDRIERGEAAGIIAWHPDRLARNWVDGGRVIHLIDSGKIVDLHFPTCTFEPTAHGKFMLSMMFCQSKYYVDNLAENIKRGKRNRIKNGYWPSSAPMGYMNEHRTKSMVIDPVRGPIVREMFDLYATGNYAVEELRDRMVKRGFEGLRGSTLTVSKVAHALSNPFYYGVMRYKGEYHEGNHTPLISQQLFERCRQVMLDRGHHKKRVYDKFPWRGHVHCGECGCGITLEIQKGHRYYRCTKKRGVCKQPYLREDGFMQQVRWGLAMVGLEQAQVKFIESKLLEETATKAAATRCEQQELREEIAVHDAKIARLTEMCVEHGISVEEFRIAKNRLVDSRRACEERLVALTQESTGWLELAKSHLSDSQRALCVAASGTDLEISDFFRVVGSNLTLRDRWLQWQPRGAWQLLVPEPVVKMQEATIQRAKEAEMPQKSGREKEWSRGELNPGPVTVSRSHLRVC